MKKGLIVSDNKAILRDATDIVKNALKDLQIGTASDEQVALDYVLYESPSLIILDTTSKELDTLNILDQINDDLWLNRMSIICIISEYNEESYFKKLEKTNILGLLQVSSWKGRLKDTLEIVHKEYSIFEYNFKSNLKAGAPINEINIKIENNILHAIIYANLLSLLLYNFGLISIENKNNIKTAFGELIINGIEHGNCGISFEEKSKLLMEGYKILYLIEEKIEKDPTISKKRVSVNLGIKKDFTTISIQDEGKGFDWRKLNTFSEKANKTMLAHGRGILMSAKSLGKLNYNDKGNKVSFKIPHIQASPERRPKIFEGKKEISYEAGDVIFQYSEQSNFLCYIISGTYKVLGENNVELAIIKPKHIFIGEMAFLLGNQRTATVIAETKGLLIHLSKDEFLAKIKQYPYYGLFLARLLANRVQELHMKI